MADDRENRLRDLKDCALNALGAMNLAMRSVEAMDSRRDGDAHEELYLALQRLNDDMLRLVIRAGELRAHDERDT